MKGCGTCISYLFVAVRLNRLHHCMFSSSTDVYSYPPATLLSYHPPSLVPCLSDVIDFRKPSSECSISLQKEIPDIKAYRLVGSSIWLALSNAHSANSRRDLGKPRHKVVKILIKPWIRTLLMRRGRRSPACQACFITLKLHHIRKLEAVVTDFASVQQGPFSAFAAGKPQYIGCLGYYFLPMTSEHECLKMTGGRRGRLPVSRTTWTLREEREKRGGLQGPAKPTDLRLCNGFS